ncbi:uncharacterized protein V2V93DRAFT_321711 [Kockiozyma suomiensis]|uniref:uncharacterized protein n=1 Tax=Kockiozyma suomiensis TaxID=1337062 RepID=UPI00334406CA
MPATVRHRVSVSRSRTGCWQCRVRRKKCDDRKPRCLTCERLDIRCEYGECPENMRSIEDRKRAARELTVQIRATMKRRSAARSNAATAVVSSETATVGQQFLSTSSESDASVSDSFTALSNVSSFYPYSATGRPPPFLSVEFDSLDFDSPISPLPALHAHVSVVPRNVYSAHTDATRQLAYAVVYFRMATRILFPGLFLQTDDLVDFQTVVYNIASHDPYVWRSVCAIGCAFAQFASSGSITVDDVSFLSAGSSKFTSEANSLMADNPPHFPPFPRAELERVMILGWNIFTLARIFNTHDAGTLKTLMNLVSHFCLLSVDQRVSDSIPIRIVAAHAVHADILTATHLLQPPILAATYGEMLDRHNLAGEAIFRTGIATGLPISTPLLLVLSRIVEFEYELNPENGSTNTEFYVGSTYIALRLENAAAYLNTYIADLDCQRTTTQRCSEMMRLAIQIYLAVFSDSELMTRVSSVRGQLLVEARESEAVRNCVRQFVNILTTEFMLDESDMLETPSHSASGEEEQMSGQELERTIVWALVVVANVTSAESGVADLSGRMVNCREVLRRTFEESVSKGEFGGWSRAWSTVKEVWKEERWTAGISWRQVLWEKGDRYPIIF